LRTNVATQNDKGIPALGVAVGFNQKEIVQLLIKRGADVGAADGRGSTALHYAAGAYTPARPCTSRSPQPFVARSTLASAHLWLFI
jgi:hypothetical protein